MRLERDALRDSSNFIIFLHCYTLFNNMKYLKQYQNEEAIRRGYQGIDEVLENVADEYLIRDIMYDAQDRWAEENYPIQDDYWPSRRWNSDQSDYVDLSGY